jgi:tetratricopeptide (TPR) repeat protein
MNPTPYPQARSTRLRPRERMVLLEEAFAICRGLATQDADGADRLHLRGLLAMRGGHLGLAVICFTRASLSDSSTHAYAADLAEALHLNGDPAAAEAAYRRAVSLDPTDPELQGRLGRMVLRRGHPRDALVPCQRAVALAPRSVRARIDLGDVLARLGCQEDAVACYEKAIQLDSTRADGYAQLGRVWLHRRDWERARETFELGLQRQAARAGLHSGLGAALRRLGRLEEASRHLRDALAIEPANAGASGRLALALEQLGSREEAIDAWLACAIARQHRGKLRAAQNALMKALALDPSCVKALFGLSALCLRRGRPRAARRHLNAALRRRPDHFGAHIDLAWSSGLLGDLPRTFQEFAWCNAHRDARRRRQFEQPAWEGPSAATRSVLVWADQALGDTIQFVRYLPLVKAGVERTILECDPKLIPVLKQVDSADVIVATGRPLPAFDRQVRVSDLPNIFHTSVRAIPGEVPFLRADPRLIARWRRQLADRGTRKIGLVWAGEPTRENAHVRFAPLAAFAPLASLSDVRFVSLQLGPQAAELLAPPPRLEVERVLHDGISISETAALLMTLDLIITIDTMIAHLAGGLARPVWTLLPYVPDWRWQARGDSSPWYPTMRLFRQRRRGNWLALMEEVREALARREWMSVSLMDREGTS